jgi:transcriptional regulator with XRE-family HTH domain
MHKTHITLVVNIENNNLAWCCQNTVLFIVPRMSLQRRFAARVKEVRRHRGLTQQQLAERIERSTNAVSSLERGLSLPTFDTLERLAATLKIPVHEFFAADAAEDPKREALLMALKTSARALDDDDLALAATVLDLISKRSKKRANKG